jgi:hypothetical protein
MAIPETAYFLSCLGEEGVEVAHRVSKALRFGLDEAQPGQNLNNRQRIVEETIDFLGALELLVERGILAADLPDAENRIAAKKAKILKYLGYAKGIGAVVDD